MDSGSAGDWVGVMDGITPSNVVNVVAVRIWLLYSSETRVYITLHSTELLTPR